MRNEQRIRLRAEWLGFLYTIPEEGRKKYIEFLRAEPGNAIYMLCYTTPHFVSLRAASKCACSIARSLLAQPTTLLYGLKELNTLSVHQLFIRTQHTEPLALPSQAQERKASLLRELQINSPGGLRVLKQTPVRSSTLNHVCMSAIAVLPFLPKITVVRDHEREWVAVGPRDGLLELVEGREANHCCDGDVETLTETLTHNPASATRQLGIRKKVQRRARRISTFLLADGRLVWRRRRRCVAFRIGES